MKIFSSLLMVLVVMVMMMMMMTVTRITASSVAASTGAQAAMNEERNHVVERIAVNLMNAPRNQCRPDRVLVDGKCERLRKSLSDIVREILDNSEGSSSFLHYQLDIGDSNSSSNNNHSNNTSSPMANQVPVSDLFLQNLAVISEANMSSCLALATCNEHCFSWPERNATQRQHEEDILEKFIPPPGVAVASGAAEFPFTISNAKSKDDTASADTVTAEDGATTDPEIATAHDFVRTIMLSAKRGIELAKNNGTRTWNPSLCAPCATEYAECNPMQYDYTTRINAIYRRLVEANATLHDKTLDKSSENLSPETLYYHYSMRFLDVANLTSCYAQVSCENSCAIYKSTLANANVEMVGPPPAESTFLKEDANRPKAIDIIHHGSLLGYKFALEPTDNCDRCGLHYKDCTADRYEIALASSNIFG